MPFFLLLLFLSLFSSATACDRCIHQAKAAFYQDEAAGLCTIPIPTLEKADPNPTPHKIFTINELGMFHFLQIEALVAMAILHYSSQMATSPPLCLLFTSMALAVAPVFK